METPIEWPKLLHFTEFRAKAKKQLKAIMNGLKNIQKIDQTDSNLKVLRSSRKQMLDLC